MKKSPGGLDRFWYCFACVATIGLYFFLRVLISEGIRQSIADEGVNNK